MHTDALNQVQRSLERALAPHLNDADQTTAYASHIARLYADISLIQDILAKIVTHKNASAEEFQTLQTALCQSWPELTAALSSLNCGAACKQQPCEPAAPAGAHAAPAISFAAAGVSAVGVTAIHGQTPAVAATAASH